MRRNDTVTWLILAFPTHNTMMELQAHTAQDYVAQMDFEWEQFVTEGPYIYESQSTYRV